LTIHILRRSISTGVGFTSLRSKCAAFDVRFAEHSLQATTPRRFRRRSLGGVHGGEERVVVVELRGGTRSRRFE
jgi:hypothetical protein